MLPAQPNQSLIDGLEVLQAVAGRGEGVGVRQLGRELGLEPTRVNRLLKTLAFLGLAERGEDRRYRPGPGIHVLAAQSLFASGLLRQAVEPLESLHHFGYAVAMGVLWRDQVAYLYHADPGMPTAHAIGRAALFPARRSGIGIALLACRSDEDVRAMWQGKPGAEEVLDAVHQARRNGYAIAVPGHQDHRSLGAVIPSAPRPMAAVAVAGRLDDQEIVPLARALRDVAGQIAQALAKDQSAAS